MSSWGYVQIQQVIVKRIHSKRVSVPVWAVQHQHQKVFTMLSGVVSHFSTSFPPACTTQAPPLAKAKQTISIFGHDSPHIVWSSYEKTAKEVRMDQDASSAQEVIN